MLKRFGYYKILLFLFMFGVFFWSPHITAHAVSFDNDGDVMDNPYGDSGLDSTISGASYVDCYIPYLLTPEDIGGYATSASAAQNQVTTGGGSPMEESILKSPVATSVMKECPYTYAVNNGWATVDMANPTGLSVHEDSETGLDIITDDKGQEYFLTAVQPWFFNHDKAGQDNFPSGAASGRGEIIDVILTDGTCIHFVCFDINAAQHTNGTDSSGEGSFDYIYGKAPLNFPQYNNLYHAQNGNTLEIWGNSDSIYQNFKNKFNLGGEEGQNRIAYYRMYNQYIWDSPQRESGVGNEPYFSYGDVTITSSSGEETSFEAIVSEWELVGMEHLKSQIADQQNKINLMSRDDLSIGEAYSVATVGENIALLKEANVIDTVRVSVVFVGLCLVFYSVLLLVAYLFDYTNSFLEISLVKIITFGYLEYSDDELAKNERGKASSKRLLFLVVFLIIIGCLFISGGVLRAVMEIMMNIHDKIG